MMRLLVLVVLYPRDPTHYFSLQGVRVRLKQEWPTLKSCLNKDFDDAEFNDVVVQMIESGEIEIHNTSAKLSSSAKDGLEQDPVIRLLHQWTKAIDVSQKIHPR